MLTKEQIDRLLSQGGNILSQDGEKIGSIGEVFVDNENDQPSWVTVKTGLFGMSESFVPLEGARTEGDDLVVPYSKDQVKDAPRMDADRPLEPAEVDRLYQHYQLGSGRTSTEATTDDAGFTDAARRSRGDAAVAGAPGRVTAGTAGVDTSGRPADDATEAGTPERTAGTAGYDNTTRTRDDAATAGAPERAAAGTTGADTSGRPADDAAIAGAPGRAAGTAGADAATAGGPERAAAGSTGTDTSGRTRDDATATGASGPATDDTAVTSAPGRRASGTAGYDTSERATDDDALTNSGARQGATEEQVTGRGRLRRYVTTETVTKTVPVQREEVRIEREPITDENRSEALSGPDGDEHEVILHEERIIVQKETVPVERVRIGTETVTDEVTVDEEVRKEHFDADGPGENRG